MVTVNVCQWQMQRDTTLYKVKCCTAPHCACHLETKVVTVIDHDFDHVILSWSLKYPNSVEKIIKRDLPFLRYLQAVGVLVLRDGLVQGSRPLLRQLGEARPALLQTLHAPLYLLRALRVAGERERALIFHSPFFFRLARRVHLHITKLYSNLAVLFFCVALDWYELSWLINFSVYKC